MMFDMFERIQRREFSPINFLLNLEWKCLGKRTASYLGFSSAEVMDISDRDNIPYNHQYIVAT